MRKIKKYKISDLENYNENIKSPKSKFGLPSEVRFCKTCVISNQRPNSAIEYAHNENTVKETINFDEDGICDACRYASEKKGKIDWSEREAELRELCDKFRSKDGSYDVIVPGSGGKDSFYSSWVLKYKYGMNPLTVTWAPHMTTTWGWKNFLSWIHSGFDNYLCTPNSRVHQLLTRLAVEKLFHPFQPFMFGQKYFAPKIAMMHNVKLVFFGENEAEYGNPISDNSGAQRDWSFFSSTNRDNIYFGGTSINELFSEYGLTENDLFQYLPCDPQEIKDNDIQIHYTGYYEKWHPQANYYFAVENGGFEACPERMPGTYSKYCSVDDKMEDFNYYTTGIKYGLGWSSYVAAHEIRSGDITREEGVALVKKYDLEFPERFLEDFLDYISIDSKIMPRAAANFEQPVVDRDYFMSLHDKFRSPHIWINRNGKWELRHKVWEQSIQDSNLSTQSAKNWEGNKEDK